MFYNMPEMMIVMSLKERLIKFSELKELNVSLFERECNLSNGFINSSGKSIRHDSLEKISKRFPDLNREWLQTGEGDMIIKSAPPDEKQEVICEECEKLKEMINLKDTMISQLIEVNNALNRQLDMYRKRETG